jgi:SAM-dependent methyltransferase
MFFINNIIHILLNKQISKVYSKRFTNYNNTPKGVFWNNTLSQDLRLNIIINKILSLCKQNTISIADIGCGYGRLWNIIKERNLETKINYYGLDINKDFISFCQKNINCRNVSFELGTFPSKKVDYIVMSGTYNLTPTNSLKVWEKYVFENLYLNWKLADKALIFNCLINQNRQIKNSLYFTELLWIKELCEKNFGKTEISKHNLLPNDITITIKKLS